MKVRKATSLILLLSPSLVNASDCGDQRLQKRDDSTAKSTSPPSAQQTTKPWYRGTEDAPVDGLDGKPHTGPFIDNTSDDRWKLEGVPERNNAVVNDESRSASKEGTTGTENGISERTRLREDGAYGENNPYEPRVTTNEQELIEEDFYAKSSKSTDYAGGLEKPEDLPDRPYSIPSPEPTPYRREGEPEQGWLRQSMPFTEGKTNNPKRSIFGSISKMFSYESSPRKLDYPDPHDADESWHEWFHSFVLSLTMILFSEIGDKTFLVAALMAMRHNQILVFTAAFGALILMTVLSAVLGHAVPTLLPKRLTTFAAALLFLVFGAKMLKEGLEMSRDMGVGEEMQEVEAELEEKEHSMARVQSRRRSSVSAHALESGRGRSMTSKLPNGEPSPPSSRTPSHSPPRGRMAGLMNLCSLVLSPAWVQTFVMTFLGEWGDRSQIATIAMAAGQDYWWVTLGAIVGHACCTGIAVIGGRALAGRVSMKVVTIGGAVAFLVFGVIYLVECIFD